MSIFFTYKIKDSNKRLILSKKGVIEEDCLLKFRDQKTRKNDYFLGSSGASVRVPHRDLYG